MKSDNASEQLTACHSLLQSDWSRETAIVQPRHPSSDIHTQLAQLSRLSCTGVNVVWYADRFDGVHLRVM